MEEDIINIDHDCDLAEDVIIDTNMKNRDELHKITHTIEDELQNFATHHASLAAGKSGTRKTTKWVCPKRVRFFNHGSFADIRREQVQGAPRREIGRGFRALAIA